MKKHFWLLILAVLFAGSASAQSENRGRTDQELWIGATYKLHLNKRWRVEAEEQLRFSNNVKDLGQTLTEVGLRYELTKNLDIKALYRYTIVNEDYNKSRISLDLSYEWDINDFPLDIIYRLRLQDAKTNYTGEKNTKARGRITLDYNLSKLADPFVEYESYFKFNKKNEFRQHRYTLGVAFKINDNMDLTVFYRMDQEINKKVNDRQIIAGVGLDYSMKIKKKEKKE